MVARLDPCNPDALRLLLADRLPPVAVGEVEAHLQFCAACRRTLDGMVGGESWWSAVRENLSGTLDPDGYFGDAHPADDPLDFLAPSDDPSSLGRIGSYEVKGVLGRGGNGVVLKALDPGLNRLVAVKVIATVLAGSAAAKKRFVREAQAAAAVVHEHVIAVFAIEEANGLPYLVMEYVTGRSLQDRLDKQGPLELKEILRIAHQTAAGLAAAHAQGLVHRDIKPANILLENGVERVKITDFGLARAVADATLTQSGVITGTPHYMAPEQARGEGIDHRADLFSLGSTLYAMATGHPPFRADTPLAVLRRVTDDAPRPLRQESPDLPGWLEAIVAKLMAKDPADRFQSASEVALLFERCLAHVQQPLSAPMPHVPGHSRWERLRTRAAAAPRNLLAAAGVRPHSPARLRRLALNAVAALAAAVGIGVGVAVVMHNRDKDPVVLVQKGMPDRPDGVQIAVVSQQSAQGKQQTKVTINQSLAGQAASLDEQARRLQEEARRLEQAVEQWVSGLKPDELAVRIAKAQDEAKTVEAKLTALRQPDELAARIAKVQDEAAEAEELLTALRRSPTTDPIGAGIRRAAEQADALEQELAPIRVRKTEVQQNKTEGQKKSKTRTQGSSNTSSSKQGDCP